jgi:hypothetical protein
MAQRLEELGLEAMECLIHMLFLRIGWAAPLCAFPRGAPAAGGALAAPSMF